MAAVVAFLKFLLERTTLLSYKQIDQPNYREIPSNIKVSLQTAEAVDKGLKENQTLTKKEIVYTEEIISYCENLEELGKNGKFKREILHPSKLVPLGISTESLLMHLINSNF